MAIALSEKGMFGSAIQMYRKAIDLQPNYPEAYNNLANALGEKGIVDSAIEMYRKAIDPQPNFPNARNN